MSSITAARNLGIKNNVIVRVIDSETRAVVHQHVGHNAATNSILTGIGHYLSGEGIFNQGFSMLSQYVPRYISLGTMGLLSQESDENGLPAWLGGHAAIIRPDETLEQRAERFKSYMDECPGFGADGYDINSNNHRIYFGLGPIFNDRSSADTVNCELISNTFPRAEISYRAVVPEYEAELPKTIDVIFSAFISTGALAQFRAPGSDYLFITEAGLWSQPTWNDSGANGLLAGYRIVPPNETNWDMTNPANQEILKSQIIRVGINQVVQVIWKIQLGAIEQLVATDPTRGLDEIAEILG